MIVIVIAAGDNGGGADVVTAVAVNLDFYIPPGGGLVTSSYRRGLQTNRANRCERTRPSNLHAA